MEEIGVLDCKCVYILWWLKIYISFLNFFKYTTHTHMYNIVLYSYVHDPNLMYVRTTPSPHQLICLVLLIFLSLSIHVLIPTVT